LKSISRTWTLFSLDNHRPLSFINTRNPFAQAVVAHLLLEQPSRSSSPSFSIGLAGISECCGDVLGSRDDGFFGWSSIEG
jgi:hypothetical protein